MLYYLAKRLLLALLVLFGISLLAFVLLSTVPGDPARIRAGPHASSQVIQEIRRGWGLDQPLPLQYMHYLEHALRGDFGRSYTLDQDVLPAVLSALPYTVKLAMAGLLAEVLIALVLGSLAAARPGSLSDQLLLAGTAILISTPTFLVGLVLLLVLGVWLHLLPLGGYGEPWPKYVLLPALAIGIPGGTWYSRLLRASLLEVKRQDFVRTARAKGVPRGAIHLRHVLPLAALPMLPIIGADLSTLLGGVVVVESVTNWPGIGLQAFNGLKGSDVPLVMGTVLLAGCFVVLINLAVDIAIALLDPRVRLTDG